MTRTISPAEAKARIESGEEAALLDVREAGPCSEEHPFFAVNCPFSVFELRLPALVPRRDAPLMLLDAGDGCAARAAEAAAHMGYTDIAVVEGGAPGWAAAGFTLFQGVNVPSKTLGELAEAAWHPATITAETLAEWQAEGRALRFFDCRPAAEHAKMSVPGAVCVPNGELAHRLPALEGEGPVVLTCAGRTRGLVGALSLARIAPDAEIYALENGTQGWALSGRDLARGNTPAALPALDTAGFSQTEARAEALIAEEGIPVVAAEHVAALRDEAGRTTYLFDVRSAEEAAEDPLPAFIHALSGQLVQATDRWVAVRGARLLLADDAGLRAALAAFWLRRMGFDARVVRVAEPLRRLPPADVPPLPPCGAPLVEARDALARVAAGRARLIDVRPSAAHVAGHPAGAVWANRSTLQALPGGALEHLVFDAGCGRAHLAADGLKRLGRRAALVSGGFAALRAAGAPVERAAPIPLRRAVDEVSFAHGRHDGNMDASRLYLSWEQGLIDQLDPGERAAFAI